MSKYVFPEPCTHDNTGREYSKSKYGMLAYFAKIYEELAEAQVAYRIGDNTHLAEELQDVITCCTSFLRTLGYDFNARQILTRQVNEKNRRRGYFADGNDKPEIV